MKKKILYCDEDESIRKDIGSYLIWYGYHVDQVSDSDDVLLHIDKNQYDLLVISRWSRPESGIDVCSKIRESQLQRNRRTELMIVGLDNLTDEEFIHLQEMEIYYLSKFRGPEKWYGKIRSILNS